MADLVDTGDRVVRGRAHFEDDIAVRPELSGIDDLNAGGSVGVVIETRRGAGARLQGNDEAELLQLCGNLRRRGDAPFSRMDLFRYSKDHCALRELTQDIERRTPRARQHTMAAPVLV